MLTDAEIRSAAERYVRGQANPPTVEPLRLKPGNIVYNSLAGQVTEEHEKEILGWRMATEAHLETIDRLRDEIRELNKENLMLTARLQGHKPAIDRLSDDIKARAHAQKLRLFPDSK